MSKAKEQNLLKTYFRVLGYSLKARKLFIGAMLLTLVTLGFKLLTPAVYALFFTSIQKYLTGIGQFNVLLLIWLTLLYFIVDVSNGLSSALSDYVGVKWWLVSQTNFLKEIYRHVLTLSMSFFENNPTGKIKERTWDGSQAMMNIIENTFLVILPQVLFVISATVVLLFIKPIFSVIILVSVPIYFMMAYYFFRELKDIQLESRKGWEDLSAQVTESIFNIRTIKTFATERFHDKKMGQGVKKAVDPEMRWQKVYGYSRAIRYTFMSTVRAITLGLGFYYVFKNQISLGSFVLIWGYVSGALDPINNMARTIDDIQRLLTSAALTFEYMDKVPEIMDAPDAVDFQISEGVIEFKDVFFSYKDRPILRGTDLVVPHGKVVAIVGRSGSGKSTMVKLLLRLYEPQKGQILINGYNINSFTQRSLRENVAVVMQDAVLFNDTVETNVKYGAVGVTKAQIERAAKISYSNRFIEQLPDGYNTIIGERGVRLSGGEQQRLNLARAVVKDAPIVVFDEATSSLDSESEEYIQKAMWEMTGGKTTIIIAHRLSTVMRADLIAVMDKGKITEIGTHKDLVAKKGIYAKLFEIQSGGYLK